MSAIIPGHLLKKVALVVALAALLPVWPGKVISSSQKKEMPSQFRVERLEKELYREKEKFELFKMKEEDILARLSQVEKDVAEKKTKVTHLREAVRVRMKKIHALQVQMAILEKSLKIIEDLLMERLVILYKYSRRGAMKILATASDLDQFRLRVKYLSVIMREDQRVLEKLAQRKMTQEKKIRGVRQELSQVESVKRGEEAELSTLKEDLENKVALLVKIHKEKEFYQIAVKELEKGAENLKETMLDLEKIPEKYRGKKGTSRFAENKGSLPSPFDGKVVRGEEVLGPAVAKLRRGVYIEGKGQEKVRSIFPGKVGFSGSVKGYGEMIIIDHGSRFFTIVAELNQRIKQRGDHVQSGEVIGLVGSKGKSGPSRLYFEIRHGGKILDPAKWLKSE